jgi:hypothetical protein
MGRTSCSKFRANQFRVLLTLAAYILFQELRLRAAPTPCAAAQVTTLRERVIKLAVWGERSARRIVLHLPTTFPWDHLAAPRARRRPDHVGRAVAASRRSTPAGVSLAVFSHGPASPGQRPPQGVRIESTTRIHLRAAERGADAALGPIGLMSVRVHE